MAPPDQGDPNNPFQSLLGDLMNMLGTNGPNQWEMVRSFALNVATGGEAEANVDPVQRIRLEQLARVAELNVTEATGMPVSSDGHRVTCVPVGRGDWTLRALEAWRPVLTAARKQGVKYLFVEQEAPYAKPVLDSLAAARTFLTKGWASE